MATSIRALGEDVAPCAISTGEDWIDGLAFAFGGAPVALDGISFRLQVRKSAASRQVYLDASLDNGLLLILPATPLLQPLAPGLGYAIGDTIRPAGGTGSVPMTLTVTALALVGLTLMTSGPGFNPGDTLPLAGGVATAPAVVTVDTVDANGRILTFHVSSPGSYGVAAAGLTVGGVAGSARSAAFGAPGWGVAAASCTDPGIYSALPVSPLVQALTSGTGAGATFAMTLVNDGLAIMVPAASLPLALVAGDYVYAIRAQADGYTQVVRSGPFTVTTGIVQ